MSIDRLEEERDLKDMSSFVFNQEKCDSQCIHMHMGPTDNGILIVPELWVRVILISTHTPNIERMDLDGFGIIPIYPPESVKKSVLLS